MKKPKLKEVKVSTAHAGQSLDSPGPCVSCPWTQYRVMPPICTGQPSASLMRSQDMWTSMCIWFKFTFLRLNEVFHPGVTTIHTSSTQTESFYCLQRASFRLPCYEATRTLGPEMPFVREAVLLAVQKVWLDTQLREHGIPWPKAQIPKSSGPFVYLRRSAHPCILSFTQPCPVCSGLLNALLRAQAPLLIYLSCLEKEVWEMIKGQLQPLLYSSATKAERWNQTVLAPGWRIHFLGLQQRQGP